VGEDKSERGNVGGEEKVWKRETKRVGEAEWAREKVWERREKCGRGTVGEGDRKCGRER